MPPGKFVAYYRVSTDRQGKSGLGLEAQRIALNACRGHRATLIIAKLDRLARNARFLLSLIDSDVNVLFCDLPQLTGPMGRFVVTQMAAVAELEAGLVSERTKQALQAAKARGQKLGNPNLAAAREIKPRG